MIKHNFSSSNKYFPSPKALSNSDRDIQLATPADCTGIQLPSIRYESDLPEMTTSLFLCPVGNKRQGKRFLVSSFVNSVKRHQDTRQLFK